MCTATNDVDVNGSVVNVVSLSLSLSLSLCVCVCLCVICVLHEARIALGPSRHKGR